MITRCGIYCDTCESYPKECAGCEAIEGKVFWSSMIGKDACPIYACTQTKGFGNCGQCDQLPCEMWIDLRDPSISEEDHLTSVTQRVKDLRGAQ